MSMDTKRLDKRVAIVMMAATTMVLFGGFAIPSVYAAAIVFRQDFETSLIPACTTEEVAFSGTTQFVFQEVNGHQTVHLFYENVKGVGIETGTKYTVHENDKFSTILNENGDTRFDTTIHGSFISSGPGNNTKVDIKLVNVVHPNGDTETIVDDVKVKCPGE
jgi:hypothetical protein